MDGVSQGNANDPKGKNGWFVGFFVNNDSFRKTSNVELKWKNHQPCKHGQSIEDKPLEGNHSSKTMSILIQGSFRFQFVQDKTIEEVILRNQGDYVIWLPNIDHRGCALKADTVMLTLRWPSLERDHYSKQ